MRAHLVKRFEPATGTGAFVVEPGEGRLTFKAGQTCDLLIPAPLHEDEKGAVRTFSIASSPADPRLMFATRLTGSAFKRSLMEMPLGTEVDLDGPCGSFTLHQNASKAAVFLAGGIGITPFRSIIQDAVERKLPHDLTLVYSNRTAAASAFMADLTGWAREHPRFHLLATITEPAPGEPWEHLTGLVDAAFITNHVRVDLRTAIFYVAGPGVFVKAMSEALSSAGADPDNVRAEEFAGY
ncbi:MAG TPA: FAD-dependent oxidoreductase [Vicinamibacterales bacterium]|nr:FAD-dependent oxidoreductase [Vicinamibacterales bacterium]